MTLEECTDMLEQLAIAMRVQMDVPSFLAYHAMLKHIPIEIAIAGLDQWRSSGPRFFPSAPEIQSWAEKARRQYLAINAWSPCVDCEDQPGWRTVIDGGTRRVQRCPCKARHEQLMKDRGVFEPIAALPGEAGVGESEQIYPTLDQLPPAIQQQIKAISAQKVLK